MEYSSDSTAIIVVDMQNDFAHPDGALYTPTTEAIIDPINTLLNRAREHDMHIVYTKDTHIEGQYEHTTHLDEWEQWGRHCESGTWGHNLVDELTPRENEEEQWKQTYDAFHGTDLAIKLKQRDITDLIIVGTLANVCVLHTASSAAINDLRPIIIEDAIGYIEEDHKEYALQHADWLFGDTDTLDAITFN